MVDNTESIINSALNGTEDFVEENPKKRKRSEPEKMEEMDYVGDEILALCSMDERKRFLIRQIHALHNSNPEAWERTIRFGDDPLSGLSESDLKTVLCVLKEECGISGPYDNAQSIASFFGNVLERNFGLEGLTQLLSTDSDIISLIHEYLPNRFQNYGGIAKLADKILEIITAVYSKQKGIKKPWIGIPNNIPKPILKEDTIQQPAVGTKNVPIPPVVLENLPK